MVTLLAVGLSAGLARSNDELGGLGSVVVSTYGPHELGGDTPSWCATQDEHGVLYVGGDKLFVADGERWLSYKMGATYAVRSLEFGSDGRLWAAGVNELGWFNQTPKGEWIYHSLRDQLPEAIHELGDVWNVFATPNGAIFVTDSRIVIWNGKQFTWWEYEVQRRLLSFRDNGTVYVDQSPAGLLRVGPNGPVREEESTELDGNRVFWMGQVSGKLTYVTAKGVGRINGRHLEMLDADLSAYLRKNILTSVSKLHDDSLALSTLNGGIIIVGPDLKVRRILTIETGLPTDEILGLYTAKDGALWAMTQAQIVRINSSGNLATFDQKNGLPSSGFLDFAIHEGYPSVLTTEGVLQMLPATTPSGQFSKISTTISYPRHFESTPDGLMVAAAFGVFKVDQSETTTAYATPFDVFRVQKVLGPGIYYASVGRKIVQFSTLNSATRDITHELPDLADNFVIDSRGHLWISTPSRGLLVAVPTLEAPAQAEAASLHFDYPESDGHAQITLLAGKLIVFGSNGAYSFEPTADHFQRIEGFPSGNVTAISNPDSHHRLWVSLAGLYPGAPVRIGQITDDRGTFHWVPKSVEGLGTIGSTRALAVQKTDDGDVLWITGRNALMRVANPHLLVATPPPVPLLRAFVRGNAGEPDRPVTGTLPYSTKRLHLEFSSVEFGLRNTLRYQTFLEGVDRDWSVPTHSAEQELANLREGKYTFKVRLLSDTGLASEPAILTFRIATPLWRTFYAYAIYVVIVGLILAGLYRLRMNTIRRRADLLEHTVRARTQDLEKANAAKTEFVASMSHEIRNPMNGIIGTTLSLRDTTLDSKQKELVTTLHNCATFLGSLVEDVLDFASIEAGAFTVQKQPFSPTEILETVNTMLATSATAAGVHFEIDVDRTLPKHLLGDPARIQQIVVNYATNALKFSGGGLVRLSAHIDNDHVTFAVTDNGPGITTEEQSALFTRFSRIKTARNAGVSGSGLGLAVCRALAERMNGTVGVTSAARRGTTFFFRFPLVAAVELDEVSTPNLPSMQGARALVVEDIGYNARSLGAMLNKFGFSVDIVSNGNDALQRLAARSYGVVFLDYDLPDMSGLEVARRMRVHESGRGRTLVVATTAYSTVEDKIACLDAGMDVFLGKPITPEKLQAVLSKLTTTPLPSPSVQMPVDEHSTFDLRMLVYLAGNSPDALQREIGRFLESVTATHREITEALLARSRPALGKAAHRMLSHARMIESNLLCKVSEALETEADSAEAVRLDELGKEMAATISELRNTLVRYRPGPTPA